MDPAALFSRHELLDTLTALSAFLVVLGAGGQLFVQFSDSAVVKRLHGVLAAICIPVVIAGLAAGFATHVLASRLIPQLRDAQRAREGEVARLNGESKSKDLQIAALQLETERARAEAERARVVRLQLEERIAPRRLTDEQKAKLVAALGKYKGTTVKLTSLMNDVESGEFALAFYEALKSAGWNIDGVYQAPFQIPAPRGTLVRTATPGGERAVALQNALASIGLETPGLVEKTLPPDHLELLVGFKPPPKPNPTSPVADAGGQPGSPPPAGHGP